MRGAAVLTEGGTCWAAGKIPTVRDVDGTTLYESNAIVRYLAAKHGEGSLWPVDAADRAQVFRPAPPPPLAKADISAARGAQADIFMDLQQTQFSANSVTMFWSALPLFRLLCLPHYR